MAKDFDALTTALADDARYDAAVAYDPVAKTGGKSLTPILALLNQEDGTSPFVYSNVPAEDVLEAAGASRLKALSPDERGRLQILKQRGPDGDSVALSRTAIRDELLDIFGITENQLAGKIPAVRRRERYSEAFGFDLVTKQDLWKVLPRVAKSYMAQYQARG